MMKDQRALIPSIIHKTKTVGGIRMDNSDHKQPSQITKSKDKQLY